MKVANNECGLLINNNTDICLEGGWWLLNSYPNIHIRPHKKNAIKPNRWYKVHTAKQRDTAHIILVLYSWLLPYSLSTIVTIVVLTGFKL
jgi:hypothetical protein